MNLARMSAPEQGRLANALFDLVLLADRLTTESTGTYCHAPADTEGVIRCTRAFNKGGGGPRKKDQTGTTCRYQQ